MADAVVSKTLRNSNGKYAFFFSNASDGTGESGVAKVDISTLDGTPTKVKITKLKWGCNGMAVKVSFDHNTDDDVAILAGNGELCEESEAPIQDPASAGGTGDILFTTIGHSSGDSYGVYLECEKVA